MNRAEKRLVHAIASCDQCDWSAEYHLTVQREATRHVRRTGHSVRAELGYVVEYGPAPPDELARLRGKP